MQVAWKVPGFGAFAYAVRLTAVEGEAEWRVRWRETAVHPGLGARHAARDVASSARGAARSSTATAARS